MKNRKTLLLIGLLVLAYLLSLFMAYPYLISDFSEGQYLDVTRNIFEYGLMFVSLLTACVLLAKNRFTKIVSWLLVLLMTVNFGISLSAFMIYKSGVNVGMIISILNTNFAEAKSMSYMFIAPVVISLAFGALFFYVVNRLRKKIPLNYKTILLALICVLLPFLFYAKHKFISNKGGGSMIKSAYFLSNFVQAGLAIQKEAALMEDHIPVYDLEKLRPGVQNIILVIGESARRQNLSLYGYPKETTPYTEKEKDQLLIYKKAVSPAGITNLSVPLVLSSITAEEFKTKPTRMADNLIALGNQADYNTYWVSIQGGASGITSMAKMAKESIWLDGFDEEVLPVVREILDESGNKLIVIHLIGSHPNPCDRVPKELLASSALDCYDTSIKYTDSILGNLYNLTRNKNTVLLYFSDHGLKISGSNLLHTDSKESTQVPFFIWHSDDVAEPYKEQGEIEEETQITLVYPLVMKYMGLREPEKYKNEKMDYLKLDFSVIPYQELRD